MPPKKRTRSESDPEEGNESQNSESEPRRRRGRPKNSGGSEYSESGYTSAAKRKDRAISGRIISAQKASNAHFEKTGKYLFITRASLDENGFAELNKSEQLEDPNLILPDGVRTEGVNLNPDPPLIAVQAGPQAPHLGAFGGATPGFGISRGGLPVGSVFYLYGAGMGNVDYAPGIANQLQGMLGPAPGPARQSSSFLGAARSTTSGEPPSDCTIDDCTRFVLSEDQERMLRRRLDENENRELQELRQINEERNRRRAGQEATMATAAASGTTSLSAIEIRPEQRLSHGIQPNQYLHQGEPGLEEVSGALIVPNTHGELGDAHLDRYSPPAGRRRTDVTSDEVEEARLLGEERAMDELEGPQRANAETRESEAEDENEDLSLFSFEEYLKS